MRKQKRWGQKEKMVLETVEECAKKKKACLFYSCHWLDPLSRWPYGTLACHPKLGHMTKQLNDVQCECV